jgi:hypothetical protein
LPCCFGWFFESSGLPLRIDNKKTITHMADKKELRELLKRKIDVSIPTVVKAHQLDEAADNLINAGRADRQLLEIIGRDSFGDREILANTDIDDINDILNQIKGG